MEGASSETQSISSRETYAGYRHIAGKELDRDLLEYISLSVIMGKLQNVVSKYISCSPCGGNISLDRFSIISAELQGCYIYIYDQYINMLYGERGFKIMCNYQKQEDTCVFSIKLLTLSTLSNYSGLFHSLFWIKLKRSVGVKGLMT